MWLTTPWQVGDAISSIGLHKGDEFISWLKTQMAAHDVTNTEQLLLKMQLANNDIRIFRPVATVSPEGPTGEVQYQEVTAQVEGPQHDRLHYPLRLVASEVTTQSMIVFPRDADMFYVSWWAQKVLDGHQYCHVLKYGGVDQQMGGSLQPDRLSALPKPQEVSSTSRTGVWGRKVK